MSPTNRNLVVFLAVAVAWVFFFVPNPWLSFFEVQGNERFPNVVFFSLPAVLAVVMMFATVGGLAARSKLALCVPLLTVVFYPIVSVAGVYSNEGMMAFPFAFIISAPTYLASVGVAALTSLVVHRTTTRNAAVVAVVLVASFVLLWASFRFVPLGAMLVVNLAAIPLLLGLAAGYLLAGRLPLKLALLALVPVTHALVLVRDELTPELAPAAALGELIALWVGCLVAEWIRRRTRTGEQVPVASR